MREYDLFNLQPYSREDIIFAAVLTAFSIIFVGATVLI